MNNIGVPVFMDWGQIEIIALELSSIIFEFWRIVTKEIIIATKAVKNEAIIPKI